MFVQESHSAAVAFKVERADEYMKDVKGLLVRIETTSAELPNSQAKLKDKIDVGLAKLDTKVEYLEGSYCSLNIYVIGICVMLIGSVTIPIVLLAIGYVWSSEAS